MTPRRLLWLPLLLGCSQPPPLPLMLDATVGDGPSTSVGCIPGAVASCLCQGVAARGIRICQDDETFTPCMCVDARVPCFAGAVQGCDCGDGVSGIQFCGEDNVFTGCMCPDTPADGGGDAGASLEDVRTLDDLVQPDAGSPSDVSDVGADTPDVCTCQEGTMRFCPLRPGQVEATYTHGRCRRGIQRCLPGACWSDCIGQVEPAPETCNGIDDNCNGLVDDIVMSCGLGPCRRIMSLCVDGGTATCVPDESQRRPETCNGVDDNCNGVIDDMCRDL